MRTTAQRRGKRDLKLCVLYVYWTQTYGTERGQISDPEANLR